MSKLDEFEAFVASYIFLDNFYKEFGDEIPLSTMLGSMSLVHLKDSEQLVAVDQAYMEDWKRAFKTVLENPKTAVQKARLILKK